MRKKKNLKQKNQFADSEIFLLKYRNRDSDNFFLFIFFHFFYFSGHRQSKGREEKRIFSFNFQFIFSTEKRNRKSKMETLLCTLDITNTNGLNIYGFQKTINVMDKDENRLRNENNKTKKEKFLLKNPDFLHDRLGCVSAKCDWWALIILTAK